MSRQPRTIKQLNERLDVAFTEVFPYGKHRNKKPEDVVKNDPNYIVWWAHTVRNFPIDPVIVRVAQKTYHKLPSGGNHWKGCIGTWEHWGNEEEWSDLEELGYFDTLEGIAGAPWHESD